MEINCDCHRSARNICKLEHSNSRDVISPQKNRWNRESGIGINLSLVQRLFDFVSVGGREGVTKGRIGDLGIHTSHDMLSSGKSSALQELLGDKNLY